MRLSFLLICILLHFSTFSQRDSVRIYYQLSMDAYKASRYQDYLKYTKRANEIRPNHPTFSYNLASAYAMTGDSQNAIIALKKYLQMNATDEYQKDRDFTSLSELPEYKNLTEYINQSSEPIIHSELFQKIPNDHHHIESITFQEMENLLVLGTVNTREILAYDSKKLVWSLQNEALYSVMGLDFSKDGKTLWVCTAALSEMSGYKDEFKDQSSILEIDWKTKTIKNSYKVNNALLGDILVLNDGQVLATDGQNQKIYQVENGEVTVFMDLSNEAYNLQGLAQNKDELYVADYIKGLYKINLKRKTFSKIAMNGLCAEKGIDGLLYDSGKLICFQNGTNPKRVLELEINKDEVQKATVIDQNIHSKGEPTQGVIHKKGVYYISNSPWDQYSEGKYVPDQNSALEIRQFNLQP